VRVHGPLPPLTGFAPPQLRPGTSCSMIGSSYGPAASREPVPLLLFTETEGRGISYAPSSPHRAAVALPQRLHLEVDLLRRRLEVLEQRRAQPTLELVFGAVVPIAAEVLPRALDPQLSPRERFRREVQVMPSSKSVLGIPVRVATSSIRVSARRRKPPGGGPSARRRTPRPRPSCRGESRRSSCLLLVLFVMSISPSSLNRCKIQSPLLLNSFPPPMRRGE